MTIRQTYHRERPARSHRAKSGSEKRLVGACVVWRFWSSDWLGRSWHRQFTVDQSFVHREHAAKMLIRERQHLRQDILRANALIKASQPL